MSHRSTHSPGSQKPSHARPPYNPPRYLLSSTGLSRQEFLAQYDAFTDSLRHIEVAPELVFERLLGNLKDAFNGALKEANARHATAEEAWRRERSSLRADHDHAAATAEQVAKPSVPRAAEATILPVLARSDETYLQFWYSSSVSGEHSSPAFGNPPSAIPSVLRAPSPTGTWFGAPNPNAAYPSAPSPGGLFGSCDPVPTAYPSAPSPGSLFAFAPTPTAYPSAPSPGNLFGGCDPTFAAYPSPPSPGGLFGSCDPVPTANPSAPSPGSLFAFAPTLAAYPNGLLGAHSKSSSSSATRVHMAATTTPIPYGLASSWPGLEHVRSSADYGCYDTRMDARIPATLLRTSFSHIVRFTSPFATPPSVMVWLTGLSAASGAPVSVQVTANNITETGFALDITNRSLRSVGVAWAVWPRTEGWRQTKLKVASEGWGQTKLKVASVGLVVPGSPRVPKFSEFGEIGGDVEPVFIAVCAVDVVLGGDVWMDVEMAGCPQLEEPQRFSPFRQAEPYSEPSRLSWRMRAGPVGAKVYAMRVAYASR